MHTLNFNNTYKIPIEVGKGKVLTVVGLLTDVNMGSLEPVSDSVWGRMTPARPTELIIKFRILDIPPTVDEPNTRQEWERISSGLIEHKAKLLEDRS